MLGLSVGVCRGGPPPGGEPLVMMFGDSRSVSMTPSAENDSRVTSRRSARNPLVWWQALSGLRAEIGAAGWGGHSSADYAAWWPVVRDQRPRAVIFHGVVNDLNAAVATGAALAVADGHIAAACFERLAALAEEVLAWGGTAIFCTEPLGEGANQAARIAEAAQYDARVQAWAQAHRQPVIDLKTLMRAPESTDAAIMLKPGWCYDSPALHLGDYGARQVAEQGFAPVLNALIPPQDSRVGLAGARTARQLLGNPWFDPPTGGVANGGVTGPAPLGWVAELSGSGVAGTDKEATLAGVARGDGRGNDVELALRSTGPGQIVRLRSDCTAAAQQALAAATQATGVRLRLSCDVEVTTAEALAGVQALIQTTENGQAVPVAASVLEVYGTAHAQEWGYRARLRTPWHEIAAATALTACQARLIVTSAGSGFSRVRFGAVGLEADIRTS